MFPLEILSRQPAGAAKPTPLLFVHGAWHGAWCWDEYWLPYFASKGYRVSAVSLRGHGASGNNRALRWTRADGYVEDVLRAADGLDAPPVLIGHSMGGYVVQKVLEQRAFPAGVLLASIPTVGSLPFMLRLTLRRPLSVLRSMLTLSGRPLVSPASWSRDLFFSADVPEALTRRWHERLQDESFMLILDSGLLRLPRPARVTTPLLVLAAANDRVFSLAEEEATARAYGTTARVLPDLAHDAMLDSGWQRAADAVLDWLDDRGL